MGWQGEGAFHIIVLPYDNMRITVGDILSYLASGMTMEEILEDFPKLTREDIFAALAYAAAAQKHTAIIKIAA